MNKPFRYPALSRRQLGLGLLSGLGLALVKLPAGPAAT